MRKKPNSKNDHWQVSEVFIMFAVAYFLRKIGFKKHHDAGMLGHGQLDISFWPMEITGNLLTVVC